MTENRVLIFAYHFPPENVIGGARPYRFYKYLAQHGYRCHVITAADVWQRPDLHAERVKDPFLSKDERGLGWNIERSVRKFLLPGVIGTQWAVRAFRAGERFLREHQGDRIYVFSTFPPLGVHAAAWLLRKRYRVPWIADFRDPLARNPSLACLGRHSQAIYNLLEAEFVRSADCIIANTDEAQRLLKEQYPKRAGRVHLIWNGFDPAERLAALPVADARMHVLSHIGELYEGRTVAPLIEALARLIARGAISGTNFGLNLVGPVDNSCLPPAEVTERAVHAGWLTILPKQVPKAQALETAQTSGYLLLVQPHSTVQVPGKLFEYLQIGRPILAFVPRGSSIERVLERSGVPYRCVYPDDSPETFEAVLLEFLALDATPTAPGPWFEETFNSERQTATLAGLIRDLRVP